MQDLLTQISSLNRPRLLVRAARIATQSYARDTTLPRLLGYGVTPGVGAAIIKLLSLEAEINALRTRNDAAYSVASHVDVLGALMGEARLLRAQSLT